jgi:prevent-host-death family protein
MSVREARDNLYRLIDDVAEHHKPVIISGKRNDAILLSKEDWDAIQETLYLTSIPGMTESIRTAAAEPVDECVAVEDLDW